MRRVDCLDPAGGSRFTVDRNAVEWRTLILKLAKFLTYLRLNVTILTIVRMINRYYNCAFVSSNVGIWCDFVCSTGGDECFDRLVRHQARSVPLCQLIC